MAGKTEGSGWDEQPTGHAEQQLWRLVCSFRQRAAPPLIINILRELSDGMMGPDSQQALLTHCLCSTGAVPTDTDYRRRVLRAVVLAAEQDGQELAEELMQLYSSCLLGQTDVSFTSCDTGGEDSEECDQSGGSCQASAATAQAQVPPLQPGWCYKLYAYAPAREPAAVSMQQLTSLQQQAACESQQQQLQQQGEEQQQQEAQQVVVQQQPCRAPITAGDGQHGLLALHVSLNLLEGGTGCHEWEAGFYLAEWVLNNPQIVAGRCCLELGCGSGMVGVALHRCGAARVICTDGDAQTVANCRLNLALNGLPLQSQAQQEQQQGRPAAAECFQLCWEDGWGAHEGADAGTSSSGPGAGQAAASQQQQQQQSPQVVLGADLLYDPTVIPVLLALLKQVLAAAAAAEGARTAAGHNANQKPRQQDQQQQRQPAAAYIATTLRNEATLHKFLAAAEADPAISIQQLAPPAAPVDGLPSTAAQAAVSSGCMHAVEHGGSSGNGSDSGSGAVRVCFQHLPELEAARGRIFLHRITLAPS